MESKFEYARQLAAGLGYIALNCLARLSVYGMGDSLTPILEPCRGRGSVMPLLQGLEKTETISGDTRFNACSRLFQARHQRKAVVIVISDFLYPSGFDDGLSYLNWHKHDVYCLQVQNEDDTRCVLKGDVELECVETGSRRRVTISPREAALYEKAVAALNKRLVAACASRQIGLASTTPEISFDHVIQDILRRGGLIA